MSERTVRSCDVCGADQAVTNGWWAFWTQDGHFCVGHADEVPHWDGLSHACGQLCCHKVLDAYFVSQRTESPQDALGDTTLPAQGQQAQGGTAAMTHEAQKPIGLTVEGLVAEQGGNPAKAIYEKAETTQPETLEEI